LFEIRSNYPKALNDKQICNDMITILSKENLNTIEKGYYGAYLVIWANHTWNPIDKLNTFKKGKIELENAIKQDSKNVELRFLRLSIQANVPKILNYDQNIKSDLIFIKEHKDKIQSNQLLKMVNEIIIKAENSN